MSKDLTEIQKQVLVGTLLGDAHLYIKKSNTKASLAFLQSDFHKRYLFHLYDVFKDFVITPPTRYTFGDKRFPGRVYKRWSFRTKMCTFLMPYANLFYPEQSCSAKGDKDTRVVSFSIAKGDNVLQPEEKGYSKEKRKKIVPLSIKGHLTARGIAFWYMDDGSPKWRGRTQSVRFCTDSFSEKEVLLLLSVLKESFQIEGRLYKETPKEKNLSTTTLPKTKNRIFLPAAAFPQFNQIVSPYLHDSMLYKYPLPILGSRFPTAILSQPIDGEKG